MNTKNLFKLGAMVVVLLVLASVSVFAQQLSTVYVDVTNGSDTYTGANQTNSPAGTGPKATIDGGLKAVANGGTIVLYAGTYSESVDIKTQTSYPGMVAGSTLTIQLATLNSDGVVSVTGASGFIYEVSGGTLNITTVSSSESLTLSQNMQLGNSTNNSTMNIGNSNYFVLASGKTLTMYGTSSLSNAAPKKGTNLTLVYNGDGDVTAGPEANYGSYGSGTLTFSKTSGTVTMPYAITAAGGVSVTTNYGATFSGTVTLGASDIVNAGTGTLTFNGALNQKLASAGVDGDDIGTIVNSAAGKIYVNAGATWTSSWGSLTTLNSVVYPQITYQRMIENSSSGTISFSSIGLVSYDTVATVVVTAYNNGGTLTLGTVTATATAVYGGTVNLNVNNNAAAGTVNVAGGTLRSSLTNVSSATVNMTGNTTVGGAVSNSGTIALGSNTLTLTATSGTQSLGTITGNGTVAVSKAGTTLNATSIPTLTIAGSTTANGIASMNSLTITAGTFTVASGTNLVVTSGSTTLSGSSTCGLTINAGQTLTTGGFSQTNSSSTVTLNGTLDVKGDFNRTVGTFTAAATSTISFTGSSSQSVNGGTLFTVGILTFTNTSGTVTLGQSIRAQGNVTINANTNVALGTLNIILKSNNAGMVNSGSYTASGGGGVIFGGATTVSNGGTAPVTGQTFRGTGVYSYITVDVGNGTDVQANATGTDDAKFNGILTLTSGNIKIMAGSFGPTGTSAKVIRDITTGSGSDKGVYYTAGTPWNTNSPQNYDLQYTGSLTTTNTLNTAGSTGAELSLAYVNNLTFSTTQTSTTTPNETRLEIASASGITINGDLTLSAPGSNKVNQVLLPAQDVTLKGTLTVSSGASLGLNDNTKIFYLTGSNKTHAIAGTVGLFHLTANGQYVVEQGNSCAINGSTGSSDAATFAGISFEPASDGYTFSSTNLKAINGDINVQNLANGGAIGSFSGPSVKSGAQATISMNATDAALTGNINVGNTTVTPAVTVTINGSNSSSHTGAITLTNGTLTYTGGTVTSTVTLSKGTFTLGSNITANGLVTLTDATLALGANKLTEKGGFTRNGTLSTVTGTGSLVMGAASTLIPGTTFSIANLELAPGSSSTATIANSMEVTGTLTHTSGNLTLSAGDLTISGNTYTYKPATATTFTTVSLIFKGSAPTLTLSSSPTIQKLEVNTSGTFTLASDKTGSANVRTLTVATALTQTAGTIAIGDNTLATSGTATFTYTAGAWTMGAGYLIWGGSGVETLGTGFAVDNLKLATNSNLSASTAFTVNKKLWLNSGTLTNSAGKLTLGDGCTVQRDADGATLSAAPTFAGAVSVSYQGVGIATAANFYELKSSVTNFSVGKSGTTTPTVTLPKAVSVSGTLTLYGVLNNTSTNNITMGNNSTIALGQNGTTVINSTALVLGTGVNIKYDGATATTIRELGALNSGSTAYASATGNLTFASGTVVLDKILTIGGTVTFDGGNFNMNGNAVTVQGDVTQTENNGFFTNTGAAKKLTFAGVNTALNLNAAWSVPSAIQVALSKTASSNTLTLSGGNLDFATNSATLYFVKGLLVTGSKVVTLKQSRSGGQPTQGFDRSGVATGDASHVVGSVTKFIDNTSTQSIDISKVDFPVGSSATAPYYRPMSFYFKNTPASSINLTVAHFDVTPDGTNGIPLTSGTKLITNYPPFYWYAKTDIALAPSYKYDLEAQAQGYSDYASDGIQNIRFVRRDSGSVNNQWVLQGADNTYDNSTIASNWPVVKVVDATGGITGQGSRFTYSQMDKPPAVAITKVVNGVTVTATKNNMNEGDTLQYTYTATDPDIGQSATLSVQSTNITGYTFNTTTGVFKWKAGQFDAGTKYITIRGTSSSSTSSFTDKSDTLVVANVPVAPTLAAIRDTSIAARQSLALTLVGASSDTDRVGPSKSTKLKYWFVSASPVPSVAAAVDSLTGAFSWTPAVTDTSSAGFTFSVKVNDGIADVVRSFKVIVVKAKRVPYYATANVPPATVTADMGKAYNFAYAAADSDGLSLTYSIVKAPAAATIAAGVLNYYVPFAAPGTYVDTITVRASNGTLSKDATTLLTRNYKNAAPKFTAKMSDGTLNVGDTLRFTYAAADSNGDALRYYGIQYPGGAKVDSVAGSFFWVAASQQTAIYVIKTRVTDNQGGADTVSAQILVQVLQVNVTGSVTYNGGTVPVNGVSVTITGGIAPQVVTTNTNGAYTTDPNKLNSGTYTFSFAKTGGHPTVYTNAADALKAALYSVDATTYPLGANNLLAADVNNDGNVNSADALQIMLRYVGSVTSFAKGDWIFVPTVTSKTLTNADFVNNVVAIAVGDVNSDAQAGGAYFAKVDGQASVVAEAGKALRVNSSDAFEVPVRVKAAASFGSMSLAFQYPVESATFVGVRGPEGMVSAANNGMVAVAWFNAENAMNLKDNDAVVTLRFKPTASIKDFSLTLDPNSQVTDAKGTVLSGIGLEVPAVDGSIPTAFAIGQNYPNPFNPSTTIQYDLPVAGHVTLVVYNMLGQVVDKLVNDQQNAGSYKIRWDASKMSSGVYLYHITVDAGKQTFKEVRRMVLLK